MDHPNPAHRRQSVGLILIEFQRSGEQSYLARLRTGDFCSEEIYAVLGDQWRLDAQFLKWHYWASLVGLKSYYRLERLEGRYRSVADMRTAAYINALQKICKSYLELGIFP